MLRKACRTRCAARRWRCSWTRISISSSTIKRGRGGAPGAGARAHRRRALGRAGAAGDRARPRLGGRRRRVRGDRALRGPRAPRAVKAEAYAILGRSQYEQGEFRLALRSLKTATELDSRMARAWYTLGLVDFDLQRTADAHTAMEAAVKADPLYAEAWYYTGRTRAMLADATAKDAYAKYLELAPKGPYAVEVREALAEAGPPAKWLRRPVLGFESVAGDGDGDGAVGGVARQRRVPGEQAHGEKSGRGGLAPSVANGAATSTVRPCALTPARTPSRTRAPAAVDVSASRRSPRTHVELEPRGGELGGAPVGGLEAQVERLAIEAEEHGGHQRRVGHRRAARHAIAARALPVVEAVAADLRA